MGRGGCHFRKIFDLFEKIQAESKRKGTKSEEAKSKNRETVFNKANDIINKEVKQEKTTEERTFIADERGNVSIQKHLKSENRVFVVGEKGNVEIKKGR